jgi:transposase, IS30 family
VELSYLHIKGYALRAIARALGRSISTISDELFRNRVKGSYDAKKAEHKAYVRRTEAKYQGMRIVHHDALRRFVTELLLDDLSPEAIAGRLRREPLPYASGRTIRRFIKSPYGRRIETRRFLRRHRRHRHHPRRAKFSSRTFITERPLRIQARRRVGDAEADFIVSGKSGRGILLVLVDRRTRHAFLEVIRRPSIVAVHAAFLHIQARFPEIRTLTLDNDILFKRHEELARVLGVKIYFCLPHHPWEKGTVEWTNRAIRRDVPKGSDISKRSRQFFRALEAKLNRRPLRVLRYRTPHEALVAHRVWCAENKKRPAWGCSD